MIASSAPPYSTVSPPSTAIRALSQKRYTSVRLANTIAITPVKTAALIQRKVWTRRNFSSCSSIENNSSRSSTLAMSPSPSVRNEPMIPVEAWEEVSMENGELLAAATQQDTGKQTDSGSDCQRLVRILADGGVGALGAGDDPGL